MKPHIDWKKSASIQFAPQVMSYGRCVLEKETLHLFMLSLKAETLCWVFWDTKHILKSTPLNSSSKINHTVKVLFFSIQHYRDLKFEELA